jgi:deoxyribose-phosphate aldolase
LLKVSLENDYLTDELKVIACRCCERAEVDFVQTSIPDIPLVRKNLPDEIGIKAAGGIGTLDQALAACTAGATRIGTTTPAAILDEWKARLAPPAPAAPGISTS